MTSIYLQCTRDLLFTLLFSGSGCILLGSWWTREIKKSEWRRLPSSLRRWQAFKNNLVSNKWISGGFSRFLLHAGSGRGGQMFENLWSPSKMGWGNFPHLLAGYTNKNLRNLFVIKVCYIRLFVQGGGRLEPPQFHGSDTGNYFICEF